MKLIIYTDGGITSDKSMCTAAFVAYTEAGEYLGSLSMRLTGTVPKAEYSGVGLAATNLAVLFERYPATEIEFIGDSELVIHQLSGRYKTKDPNLKKLRDRCITILDAMGIPYSFRWVRGHNGEEGNELADFLCTYTKDNPPKTDIWAPVCVHSEDPSLGQLFKEGKLRRARSMKVDAEGFGLCDRCKGRLIACECPALYGGVNAESQTQASA